MFYPREKEVINWNVYIESYHFNSWIGIVLSIILSLLLFLPMLFISQKRLNESQFNVAMAFSFATLSQVSLKKYFDFYKHFQSCFLIRLVSDSR